MNNLFLPSNMNNDVTFINYGRMHEEDKPQIYSITDTIVEFLMKETKIMTQLFQEWIKLSTMLSNYPLSESYLSQWRWMNSLLSETVKEIVETKEENEFERIADKNNAAENSLEKQLTKEHLRILFLTWEFPPCIVGGLSRHVHGLTKSLAKKGHEIHVITTGSDTLPVLEKVDNVIVHRVHPLNVSEKDFLLWIGGLNIAIADKAAALLTDKSFDCIHSHDWLVGAAAVSLKKNLDLPLVTTIHATEYGRNNGIYTEMQRFIHGKERQLVEQSDRVVVCSNFMQEEVLKLFKPTVHKLATIPNGIDCEREKGQAINPFSAENDMDSDRKMIFSIGRMVKEKGFDTLIEAAAILKGLGANICFIIAGKGPMLEVYRRKVVEMQLTDTVRFIGFIDDDKRDALLELCEMAVFPSIYEPFGIVALEAMKAGKPTIVSNTGGLKGIVQHLETGLLIEPENSKNVAEQIMLLLENPEMAMEIGENGKKAIESQYNWKLAAAETVYLYNNILQNRKHHQ
ncbi:glycosyltransferase family 4 protein [Niallia endozanthoxylica]|uniref:Glycosyltransferase family 4 protein n=1 Tax=Niallia endozanthoxylica TaxID=2036016 RepID=A0A5J5HWM3_9BACI|nr:glycosyltransferase family 4 protein [Niallia endozanthoxylica]KAA9026297.1 glycosyltransferase family 4 protein [Niallia endozanthoxylica]